MCRVLFFSPLLLIKLVIGSGLPHSFPPRARSFALHWILCESMLTDCRQLMFRLKAASSVRHWLVAWSHDLVDELHEDLVEHTVLMISKSCKRTSTDFSADL